jgi:hypothetical protein
MDTAHYQELLWTIQSSTAKDWFDYLIGIGSLVTSIVAVIIGIKISNRLSLKGKVLEKQLETVFSLLHVLQHQRFHLDVTLERWMHHTSILEIVKDKSWKDIIEAKEKKLPMYFEWSGYNEFRKIRSYKNNPYLPIVISNKLDNFDIYADDKNTVTDVDKDSLPIDHVIHSMNIKENHANFERHMHSKSELKSTNAILYRDFCSFYSVCENLVETIEDWLRQYEAHEINLKLKSNHSLPFDVSTDE